MRLSSRLANLALPLLVQSVWMLIAHTGRMLVQVGYFVIIARVLGVQAFGAFAAAASLVLILAPLSGCGTSNLLLMRVSLDPSHFRSAWGDVLLATLLFGSPLILLTSMLGKIILPTVSAQTILFLAAAEFLFIRIVDAAPNAYLPLERMSMVTLLNVLPGFVRLCFVGIFAVAVHPLTPALWAAMYLAASVLSAIIAFSIVTVGLGSPEFVFRDLPSRFKQGSQFAISVASNTVYYEVDKLMIGGLASAEAAGVYAAAYRAITVAMLPINAILSASYARFFRQGTHGLHQSMSYAQRILPVTAIYGVAAAVGLFAFAPLVPIVLGDSYKQSVSALRWLAILPALRGVQEILGEVLSGAGYVSVRGSISLIVAIFNISMNVMLIPIYSWKGAVWASLLSSIILILSLTLASRFYRNSSTGGVPA